MYEIHVSELLGGRYGGSDSKAVESAVDSAMSRVLTLRDEKGWTKYHVFSRCRYRASEGVLELGFHPDLKSHYLGLQEKFGQYNLTEFMLLPSVYSQRIFELLKSWTDKPEFTISLSDLFLTLDVPKTLQRYPDFRRKVLERAHKDISTRTGLRFEWEAIKRVVLSLQFVSLLAPWPERQLPPRNKLPVLGITTWSKRPLLASRPPAPAAPRKRPGSVRYVSTWSNLLRCNLEILA